MLIGHHFIKHIFTWADLMLFANAKILFDYKALLPLKIQRNVLKIYSIK